jgi:hypothetical protein
MLLPGATHHLGRARLHDSLDLPRMSRKHWHPSACKVCGDGAHNGVHISQTGLCPTHSLERMTDNLEQLKAHAGPRFTHWRYRLAASVGAVPLDVLTGED